MIYEDRSVLGQKRLECVKKVREGTVRYVHKNNIVEEKNNPSDRHHLVSLLEAVGVPKTEDYKFGILVFDEDDDLILLHTRWPSQAEVKQAARDMAILARNHIAIAVEINKDAAPKRKTREDDPEEWDRDHEISRARHPEENPY